MASSAAPPSSRATPKRSEVSSDHEIVATAMLATNDGPSVIQEVYKMRPTEMLEHANNAVEARKIALVLMLTPSGADARLTVSKQKLEKILPQLLATPPDSELKLELLSLAMFNAPAGIKQAFCAFVKLEEWTDEQLNGFISLCRWWARFARVCYCEEKPFDVTTLYWAHDMLAQSIETAIAAEMLNGTDGIMRFCITALEAHETNPLCVATWMTCLNTMMHVTRLTSKSVNLTALHVLSEANAKDTAAKVRNGTATPHQLSSALTLCTISSEMQTLPPAQADRVFNQLAPVISAQAAGTSLFRPLVSGEGQATAPALKGVFSSPSEMSLRSASTAKPKILGLRPSTPQSEGLRELLNAPSAPYLA